MVYAPFPTRSSCFQLNTTRSRFCIRHGWPAAAFPPERWRQSRPEGPAPRQSADIFQLLRSRCIFSTAGQQFTQPASIISNELRAVHLFPSCPGKGECAADRRKLVYDVRTSVATAYPCSNTRPESVPLKACKEVDVEDGQGCEGVFLDPHAFHVGHLRARRPGASRDRSLALDAGRSGNGNLAAAGRPL